MNLFDTSDSTGRFWLRIPLLSDGQRVRFRSARLEAVRPGQGTVTLPISAFERLDGLVRTLPILQRIDIGDWLVWPRPTAKLLLVGDGYTAQSDFLIDAALLINKFVGMEWLTRRVRLQFITAFTPSVDTGAGYYSDCSAGSTGPSDPDTVYTSKFGPGNCELLRGNPSDIISLRDSLGADAALCLVNTERYGGSDSYDVTWFAAKNSSARDIAVHEFGHVMGLGDEYDYNSVGGTYSSGGPNLANNAGVQPWSHPPGREFKHPLCLTSTGLHLSQAQPGEVGAFQGANYSACGWYRPTINCEMRDLSAEFCSVCRRLIIQKLHALAMDPNLP